MLLSLVLVALRGDTGTLYLLDLENGTPVPSRACVACTTCWWVQLAPTCALGEARSLPAGHPLKWLETGLQPAALAGRAGP